MTAVYLIRHPQTTWNVAERYQGRLDSPLSAEGRRQAGSLARVFSGCPVDVVCSSPLSRAVHLARELARATDAPLQMDNRLTEIGMDTWEGLTRQEIRERYPDQFRAWYTRPDTVTFANGESMAGVSDRSQGFLRELFARSLGHVVVVTHSAVVRAMVLSALCLDPRYVHNLHVSNASITTLLGSEVPGMLLTLNDIEPLYHSPVAAAAAYGRDR